MVLILAMHYIIFGMWLMIVYFGLNGFLYWSLMSVIESPMETCPYVCQSVRVDFVVFPGIGSRDFLYFLDSVRVP